MKKCVALSTLGLMWITVGCDAGPLAVETDPTNLLLPQAAAAAKPSGPITIQTLIDFSAFPFSGTFTTTAGSDVLGCSSGAFVDHPANAVNFNSASIRKELTCTSGGSGTFTVNFDPPLGHWNVLNSSGDFANLKGQGDFSVILVGPTTGAETLTGKIHFAP